MSLLPPVRRPAVVPFVAALATHGGRPAIVTDGGTTVSYADLALRVAEARDQLVGARRLVLVAGANQLDVLVWYLGALAGGHAVLLAPGDDERTRSGLVDTYAPDVEAGASGLTWFRDDAGHDLHPDLALLLTTSGSTGSRKLVRLSHANLQSNAEAIAEYLGLGAGDRAATSLPLHYCYGLSVVHSHLARGASLLLTRKSVVDQCFWEAFRDHEATSFSGVPHTFDLLDRVGFERLSLPSLRYVTQAGGRMAPDTVRRYAELGRRRGWQLFVMYGQTEATARMAYLPPALAVERAEAIGIPIPGGSITVEPLEGADAGIGELVYRGPNVMLGYAHGPADLAAGATVDALRTGDLGRQCADGLYEVVGRCSRFLKLFGLRVDLDEVERFLATAGLTAACTGDDRALVVAVEGSDAERERAAAALRDRFGLPGAAVRVLAVAELPRLGAGKVDYAAVLGFAAGDVDRAGSEGGPAGEDLCAVFTSVLQRPAGEADTFVSLGGDSLSYVEMSVRLEEAIGHLPPSWHLLPIRQLADGADARSRRPRVRHLETSVVLRAVGIALIVATHAQVFRLQGSAHVLLGIAGFNFSRFQLSSPAGVDVRHLLRSIANVVVPSVAWIGLLVTVSDQYRLANLFLLNDLFGPQTWDEGWRYWYVETLVQILVALAALFAIPAVRNLQRRRPAAVALAVLAVALAVRFGAGGMANAPMRILTPHTVLFVFALGWVAERCRTAPQRIGVSLLCAASIAGYLGDAGREATTIAGLLALVWVPRLPVVRPLHRVVGVVAAASLYVYLTHWQVLQLLPDTVPPWLTAVVALAAGAGAWAAVGVAGAALRQRRHAPL